MNNRSLMTTALLLALSATQSLVAAPQGPANPQASTKQIVIDYSKLDTAQGWEQIATGVYQRIDADGTISSVSLGDAGRRYDLGIARSNLALTKQKLENAMQRRQPTKDLLNEIVELEDIVQRLTQKSDVPTSKGNVNVEDSTNNICHSAYGVIWANFSTSPRSGGGTIGNVTSDVRFLLCQGLGFGCNPADELPQSGYDGRAWSNSRAQNSGGVVYTTQNSNNGAFVNLWLSRPSAQTAAGTANVADPACTLRAGGGVQTTISTTPFQTCSLYKSFTITKTCAQIP